MSKKHTYFAYILIVIACFLLYGNTLQNDYSLDDHYVIENNSKTAKGVKGIPEIFASHYIENKNQSYGYRPVTLATFAIEHEFFGANPFISHLINLLLYVATCLILFLILKRIFREYHWLLPLLTIGLFLIHPIHTEVINNIKSRDELLSFLFALLALRMAIKYTSSKKIRFVAFSLILMLLALMSKLSSLTFLVIIPVTLYFFENLKVRNLIILCLLFLSVFILFRLSSNFLIDSNNKLREFLFYENPLFLSNGNIITRIPMALYTVAYYLKLLIWPFPLLFYYGYNHVPIVSWSHLSTWMSFIIVIPLIIYTFSKIKTKRVMIFGFVYFFISVSMFSNLVKPVVGIIGERFSYIPSLGICIVFACLILNFFNKNNTIRDISLKKKPILIVFLSLLFISSTFYIIDRNKDWKNRLTLAQNDIKYLNKSVKAHSLLGDYNFKEFKKSKNQSYKTHFSNNAIFHYSESLNIYDKNPEINNNIGVLKYQSGVFNASIFYFNEAIDLAKKSGQSNIAISNYYYNLASAYDKLEDFNNSILNFENCLQLDEKNIGAYDKLMKTYFDLKRYEDALKVNIRVLTLYPENDKIILAGQQIAEVLYGKETDYYLNLILEKGLINKNNFGKLKDEILLNNNFNFQ